MTTILKTTLATALAAACLAGSSLAFAKDATHSTAGDQGNVNGHQTISRNSPDQMERLDQNSTGSITTCDDKTSKQNAACYNGLPKMK